MLPKHLSPVFNWRGRNRTFGLLLIRQPLVATELRATGLFLSHLFSPTETTTMRACFFEIKITQSEIGGIRTLIVLIKSQLC